MVDSVVTKQELINAQKDAQSLEDVINGPADTRVKPRIGPEMWTLATINSLVQQGQIKISDLDETIQIALAAGAGSAGWTANLVADGNQTQKEINLFGGKKYDMPVGGYPLGAVVRLDNGDIVKSTVPNNTANPNVDMTGWKFNDNAVDSIADLLAIQNPKDGQVVFVKSYYTGLNKGYGAFYYSGTDWARISNKGSLEGYGLRGDGITNDQYAIALSQTAKVPLTIESKEVYAPVFLANLNCNLDGNNTTVYVNSSLGMSVSVQIRGGSRLSNIKFDNSRAGSLAWSYAGIGSNVYLKDVGFYGFRDDVLVCSWGVLLTEVKDITFDNCHFGNNSQSDIAFTDNVENITIINAKNEAEGGVSLNFEPNDTRYCRNVQVIGGTYRLVQILENSYLSTSIQGLSFTGALIKDLIYDGGDVVFTNTIIEKIRNEIIGGDSWAGSMRSDSINISPNLVKDPYFLDVAATTEVDKYWGVFDPVGNNSYAYKYNAIDGRYLQLNQNDVNNEVGLETPLIDTNGASTMLLACSMRGAGSELSANNVRIYFYNSSGSQVGDPLKVITVRGDAQNKLNWKNTVLFFDVPDGVSKIKLYVRNQPTASVCIRSIGLYNYALLKDGTGNFNTSLDEELYKPLNVNQASYVQSFTQYGSRPTPMTGDKVVINTLASGATRELMFNGTDWVATLKNNTY